MARETHFVVKYSSYLGTAIKLVLYILKQLFASVSVNSGGYLSRRSGSVNSHRYSPPLRRIIVNCQHCTRDGVAVVCWTSKLIKPRRPVSRDGSNNAFEQCKQRRSEKVAELGIRVSCGTGRYRGEGAVCFGSELGLFILTHRYRGLALNGNTQSRVLLTFSTH